MTIIGAYCPLCPIIWNIFDEWVWGDGSKGNFPDKWDDICIYKMKDKKEFEKGEHLGIYVMVGVLLINFAITFLGLKIYKW